MGKKKFHSYYMMENIYDLMFRNNSIIVQKKIQEDLLECFQDASFDCDKQTIHLPYEDIHKNGEFVISMQFKKKEVV